MATKGVKLSEEHKNKISKAHVGKHHTEETKQKMRKPRSGWVHGGGWCCTDEIKLKMRLLKLGDKNPNWRGGIRKSEMGYVYIYNPNHPYANKSNCVFEHRLIMEEFLARFLLPEEVVHHINGILDDNRIENLMLFASGSEHARAHVIKRHNEL